MKKLMNLALFFILLFSFTQVSIGQQGDPNDSDVCTDGSSWQCIDVAKYASGDCAYYQGTSCLWCDCYAE